MSASSNLFDNEQLAQDLVMSELDETSKRLLALILERTCGTELLRFLNARANTLLSIDDIAFYVGNTCAEVEGGLSALVDLGFARRLEVTGLVFYGAPSDPARRQLISSLCAWQDRWSTFLARLSRVDPLLDGNNLTSGRGGVASASLLAYLTRDLPTRRTSYVD